MVLFHLHGFSNGAHVMAVYISSVTMMGTLVERYRHFTHRYTDVLLHLEGFPREYARERRARAYKDARMAWIE